MLKFANLIACGRLGTIGLGASKEEIIEQFGEPTHVLLQKNPEILKYGPIEFALYRARGETVSRLASVCYSFASVARGETLPATIEFSDAMPSDRTTVCEFRDYLKKIGVSAPGEVASEAREYLMTDSGARISFEKGRLRAIQVVGRERERPAQFSVSVAESELQPIRSEAMRRGKSVSQLTAAYLRNVKAEAGRMAMKTDIDLRIEAEPDVFVAVWKLTKLMNDEAGQGAGLLTASWRLEEEGAQPRYALSVTDPWGTAEAEFTRQELLDPDLNSTRARLCDLLGGLIEQSLSH